MPQTQVRDEYVRVLQEMTRAKSRLLVLDRDGVINATLFDGIRHRGPWSVEQLELMPAAADAVAAAAAEGFRVAVATNQPDITRGAIERRAVDEINQLISLAIPAIDTFYVCPHDNSDGCLCRKPKPGMLLDAAAEFDADPALSWMVGDRWTDVAAGQAAGFRTVLIRDENSMKPTSIGGPPDGLTADITVSSITEAVAAILDTSSGGFQPGAAQPARARRVCRLPRTDG